VLFAIFMWWAYPVSEYLNKEPKTDPSHPDAEEATIVSMAPMSDDEKARRAKGLTSIWKPLWDSINFSDFAKEIWSSLSFFFDFIRGKPEAHSHIGKKEHTTFATAFGVEGSRKLVKKRSKPSEDQSGVGLIRARTPTSEAGAFSYESSDYSRTPEGMGEAYRLSPISKQPASREPPLQRQYQSPDSPASQQGLSPQQQESNPRWSSVGMAL